MHLSACPALCNLPLPASVESDWRKEEDLRCTNLGTSAANAAEGVVHWATGANADRSRPRDRSGPCSRGGSGRFGGPLGGFRTPSRSPRIDEAQGIRWSPSPYRGSEPPLRMACACCRPSTVPSQTRSRSRRYIFVGAWKHTPSSLGWIWSATASGRVHLPQGFHHISEVDAVCFSQRVFPATARCYSLLQAESHLIATKWFWRHELGANLDIMKPFQGQTTLNAGPVCQKDDRTWNRSQIQDQDW
jgi:hypothetical protein